MSDGDKYYREKAEKEDWELLGKVVRFYTGYKERPHGKFQVTFE